MSTAFIALGSNLNDPARQLRYAIDNLHQLNDTTINAISRVYRSEAVGPGDQADYLNAVIAVTTDLLPLDLLDALQAIENRQGRRRDVRWGERTLDLDILLYDEQTLDTERLSVPHTAMKQRNFVLQPLADLTGLQFQLPDGAELGTLLKHCPASPLVPTGVVLDKSIKQTTGVRL